MHTQSRTLKTLSLLLLTAAAFFLNGCGDGSTGATGPAGTTPAAGSGGGVPGAAGTVSAAAMTPAQFAALAPVVDPASVSVSIASAPVVKFKVTDANGNPLIGLANASKSSTALVASYANFGFTLAKLVPGTNGSPSKWVSYNVTTVPTTTTALTATRPSTDNTGTLVDNGDGTYTYTFYRDITKVKDVVAGLTLTGNNVAADLGDLSYDPTLTHRLGIQISGNAPGTGTNTPTAVQTTAAVPMQHPINVIYDFIPASGKAVTATDTQRVLVDKSNCQECHAKIGGIPGTASQSGPHSGSRFDPKYCVTCHTDQIKFSVAPVTSTNYDFNGGAALKAAKTTGVFGNPSTTFTNATGFNPTDGSADGETIGNFPVLIHKIHMGVDLVKTGYNWRNAVAFNQITYPQDKGNCTKCHDNTKAAQADNYKNVPTRLACGACHDGINWTTGAGVTLADAIKDTAAAAAIGTTKSGHLGLAQADDSQCTKCHSATDIPLYHEGPTATTHSTQIPGVSNVVYAVSSASINSSGQPVITFSIKKDGTAVVVNTSACATPITGFTSTGPTIAMYFALPQDGIATPADFNGPSVTSSLSNLCSGTQGTLVNNNDGTYTATITKTSAGAAIAIPTSGANAASLATAAVYGALTQASPKKYDGTTIASVTIKPMMAKLVAKGYTGRRQIVDVKLCNQCHDQLGTNPDENGSAGVARMAAIPSSIGFHGGSYNDPDNCNFCHTVNRANGGGWSANSKYWYHAIHAGEMRTVAFNADSFSTTVTPANIKYPGVLSNCQACHLAGMYDFSSSVYTSALMANLPYLTVSTGKYAGAATSAITTYTASTAPAAATCTAKAGTAPTAAAWALTAFRLSPYVTADANGTTGTNYGQGYSTNLTTAAVNGCKPDGTPYTLAASSTTAAGVLQADGTTLVHSPIAGACFACHDSSTAISHMKGNGGSIYTPRSTALATVEQCLVCHGSGKVADIAVVHPKP